RAREGLRSAVINRPMISQASVALRPPRSVNYLKAGQGSQKNFGMLLAREFVSYLSRQVVRKLTPQTIETPNPPAVAELIGHIISEELAIEDRLNDEVREI